ncbi:MAG: hypothetical protein RPS47_04670 [Colwellia sp.]
MKVSSGNSVTINNQRGFASIIGALFIIAVISFMFLSFYSIQDKSRSISKAEQAGRHLQTMSFSVMKLISEGGMATVAGTFVGTNWLKGPSCTGGLASGEFLDCAFRNTNIFGSSYSTVVTVNAGTGVVTAVVSVPWPNHKGEIDPNMGALMRRAAASFLSGNSPVAQTFSDYTLDIPNQTVIATISTSVSNDIWFRTDGSNQMNADANIGGNSLYNVVNIYGGTTAAGSLTDNINLGSAVNISGVLTIDSVFGTGLANSAMIDVLGFDDNGDSITTSGNITTQGNLVAIGNLFANEGDFLSRVVVGDGAGGDASIEFRQYVNGDNSNVVLTGSDGDLFVENGNDDATVIADKLYIQALNRYASQGVYNITMAQHLSIIEKPTCPAGLTPQIFVSMSGLAQSPGRPISTFDVVAIPLLTSWQVDVRMITDGPSESPDNSINSRVLVITKCS